MLAGVDNAKTKRKIQQEQEEQQPKIFCLRQQTKINMMPQISKTVYITTLESKFSVAVAL